MKEQFDESQMVDVVEVSCALGIVVHRIRDGSLSERHTARRYGIESVQQCVTA